MKQVPIKRYAQNLLFFYSLAYPLFFFLYSNSFTKAFLAFLLWMSFFYIIQIKRNSIEFRPNFKICISLLVCLAWLSILHTLFNTTDPWLDKIGNRYATLFLNAQNAPVVLLPITAYYISLIDKRHVKQLFFIAVLGGFFGRMFIGDPAYLFVGIPFIPMLKEIFQKSRRYINCLILIPLIGCIIIAFVPLEGADTGRTYIIYLVFILFCIINNVFFPKRTIFIRFLFYFVMTILLFSILFSIIYGATPFELIGLYLNAADGDGQLGADTRSFLYREVFEDMSQNNALLFGKGAYCHYHSSYFEHIDDADFEERMGVECLFLNLFLKCGSIYILIYLYLMISAIRNVINKSKSLFMHNVSIVLIGWLLIGFISGKTNFELFVVIIWLFVGLCHSNLWLKYSDKEINRIIWGNGKISKIVEK